MTAFEEMGVMPEIAQALEEMDWSLPTDIQSDGIPMILGGGDVLMAAETGSGKTGAFSLPLIQIIHETLIDIKEGKGQGAASAPKVPAKWRMNMFDRGDSLAIDLENGVLCQSRDPKGWHGCRSNKGVSSKGRYFYEAKVTDEGLCRVGWSTMKASLDLGTDREGYGFGGTGKKSFGKQFDSYGEAYGQGDVIGCCLDLDKQQIRWYKNGEDLGTAYTIESNLKNSVFFAAVGLKNAEIKFNFGESDFSYPIEAYTPLCNAPKDVVSVSSSSGGGRAAAKPKPKNAPYALIMEPSRELAEQTLDAITKFKKNMPEPKIQELLIIGGVNVKQQMDTLYQGVDIICGTPGRLEDLISTNKIDLSCIRFFVLDECDGLLSAGYSDMIQRIHAQIPKVTSDGRRLQMIVASATLHNFDVKKMAEKLMHFPTWIDLKGQDSVPETVHHCVLRVDPKKDTSWKNLQNHVKTDAVHESDRVNPNIETPEMMSEAIKILKGEYTARAIKEHKMEKAIIFCRTKIDCDNMERYLKQLDRKMFTCVCLHGDRKPQERKSNLEQFKRGEVKYMICTDVAARGIDVAGLPFVINVTLPDEKQNYVHRIGRVGRAERMGLAISFAATEKEKVWYHSNCNNRGKGCFNTNLTDRGGCCIWYNENQYLGDIEDHLGVTIEQIGTDLKVPLNDFDGKVVYGTKQRGSGSGYRGHVDEVSSSLKELTSLETKAQNSYITLMYRKPFSKNNR